ncbi:MAG: hypothetical protein JW837_19275 [Sedimentisphaerales bacterium]|nr:hypothetical protein [Sedimentisphaerales bacterium]
MYYKYYRQSLCFLVTLGLLIFSGCAIEPPKPVEVVSGKSSVNEAISVLKARSEKAVPLLARGRCVFEYYNPESKSRKKEQLAVVVLMQPPVEIYLQGDATLVPKALILGSNEQEFWLLLRPKEISTYWWGTWSEQKSYEGLMINPRTLFEALGFLEIESNKNWSLSSKGIYDVLTQRNRGVIVKKMHISKHGYLISKIEYFNSTGQALAMAELKNYRKLAEGFYVPASISIITYKQDDGAEPLGITFDLSTIKPKELSERQQTVFERPPAQGFDNILRSEGGKWIKENQ